MTFKKLQEKKEKFLRDPDCVLKNESGLTELLCSDCEFYKEGQEEELACGAYNILARLLEKKVLTADQIVRALTD